MHGDVVGEPAAADGTAAEAGGKGFPRRTFIAGAGAVAGAAAADYIAHAAFLRGPTTSLPKSLLSSPLLTVNAPVAPTISFLLRRREDMLFLRVDGYNLIRQGQKLVRKKPGKATLVFTFVPQHLTERAFFQTKTDSGFGNEFPNPPGSTGALLAAPSRVAFLLPPSMHSVPYTVAGLLDWSKLQPSLAPPAAYVPPLNLFLLLAHNRRQRERAAKHHAAVRQHKASARVHKDAFRGAQRITTVDPKELQVLPAPPAPPLLIFGVGHPPKIRAPEPTETSIELPWHLAISPIAGSQWAHPTDPVTLGGGTELWRTRLARGVSVNAKDGGSLRAIWNFDTRTHDFASPGNPTLPGKEPSETAKGPFRTSLTPKNRFEIVKLTSDFALRGRADIQADKLWLTARGGFLDSDGNWDDPTLSLLEWKHLATLGRDQYVKVVEKGFLFPFGHHVVQVTITEREFDEVGGEIVAASRQIQFLVVRQPTISYDPAVTFGIANNSRDFPFRSLTLNTQRTPPLDPPTSFVGSSYVPMVGGVPFKWHFVGTDWVGREIPFTAQAVFVIYEDGVDAGAAAAVRGHYNSLASNDPLRTAGFGGQAIAFAEALQTGDTDLQVKTMTFGASPGAGGSLTQFQDHDQAQCYPTLLPAINGVNTGAFAVVRLASAEQASGNAPLKGNSAPAVAYYPPYVTTGFSTSQAPTGNAGNVYMEILFNAANATNLSFGGGSSGGVLTPNLQLQGISRSLGPVADLDNIFSGKFDPNSIFSGLSNDLQARILGGVLLADLIAPVESFLEGASPEIPNPKALRITYAATGTVVTTSVVWKPDIVADNPIVTPQGGNPKNASFELDATVTTDLANPNNSTYTITGTLKKFVVNLMSTGDDKFIEITFDSLTFSSVKGQKANVDVKIHAVQFVGPLKFVQQLQEFMDFSGEGGPKIELKPTGISADLTVNLPTIAVGLFQLSHVGIDANFLLPYDGSPAVFGFGFSTRANPFQLSIAIFGGGGYFGIKIGTDGVHEIDAGFDFGAMCAINLGVASGSVSLTAGFQFTYSIEPSSGKHTCVLTGYVKLTGNLSILGGIISMSLEFDLSLTYQEPPSSVTGTATVSISISILFFHFSVSATATKTFTNSGGSGGSVSMTAGRHPAAVGTSPPTFADQMSQTNWHDYCQAFA